MGRATLSLLLAVLLASCTPQKRLQRLLKKHPHLVREITVTDTVRVEVPGARRDTLFSFSTDTVVIREGHAVARYYYDRIRDTVWLSAECEPITVEKIVEVPGQVIEVEKLGGYRELIVLFALLIVGALIFRKS